MRRIIALAVLVAFMPTANAQDKAKAEFSHDGEYRLRYWWTQNPSANENTQRTDSSVDSRFKLGTTFKASEKMSAHLTLLHNAEFGQSTDSTAIGSTSGDTTADNQQENMLTVNQAYANWMFSDDMSFRVGRQNYQIADGSVIGYNDWETNPGAFEGLLGNWEAGFGKFQVFLFKHRELTAGAGSASADPEHNSYGLNFDMKTTPEWFKALNVHVIKDNQDAVTGATGTTVNSTNGQDLMRAGLMAGFNFGMVDLKAWYEMQSGEYKNIAAGGAKTSIDSKGSMMQAEVGFNLDSFMGSRFHVLYHQDTGDGTGASATETEQYDPYFYEQHANAGLMDLFNWGNLTYITVGWNGKASDKTSFGAMYHMFSRTESGTGTGGLNTGTRGTGLTLQDATKDKLGDELDLWAEHMYDGGLSTVVRVGYFMPGDAFKNVATPTSSQDDEILQVMLEGRLSF